MQLDQPKPEDLRVTCPACLGSKVVRQDPADISNYGGAGRRVIHRTPESCPKCIGHGFVLTPVGRIFMDFMFDSEVQQMASTRHRPMV